MEAILTVKLEQHPEQLAASWVTFILPFVSEFKMYILKAATYFPQESHRLKKL